MRGTVSVESAAKQLGMDPMTLRYMIRERALNVGFYFRRPDCKRGTYFVYQKLVDKAKEELGIGGEDAAEEDSDE